MLNNLPEAWDMEADLVAIGSGIGGLSAAITAYDQGLSALVLERSDQVGGVTALSMGEVWVAGNHLESAIGIEDSADSGFRYLKRLSMDYGSDAAILNQVVHAPIALKYFEERIGLSMEPIRDCPDYYYTRSNDAVAEGRMLECRPFPGRSLGDWAQKTRVSPQMPYGFTHHDMFENGGTANIAKWNFEKMAERLTNDERCLGAGLAAYFVKGALDRGIPMHTGTSAEELIGNGTRVIGVRVVRDGRDVFVKANKGVVVAVSSYERNQDYTKTLSQQLEIGSMVMSTVNGANFRLAGPVGARVASVPDITSLGFTIPGMEDEEGHLLWNSALPVIGQPHTIVVNRAGKRFGNEAFYRSFYYAIDLIDGGDQTHPNFPCWTIIDSQARDKYPFGSIMPQQEWPEGLGTIADTLGELAAKIGIDAAALEATVERFNAHAEKGVDPDFGRGTHPWSTWMCGDIYHKPSPVLGPLSKGPFYAVEMKRMGGSAITATGILADEHGQALGWDDKPIAGLYVAGNSMARMETGAVMQSGISNARGMTYGWLIGNHAAGKPSDLLVREARRMGL
ncbi:3-oxosteroid 1-dehydrogenase [Novosphingobium chloroacetimidivorans]|uniref:3-oxosteroid 1-dehydrogenase n=1 Tax=Novosphingobium chloroacetimidivorans TaxID=1428314 RepID=A0A7W7KD45_9SPHN|nr:FAD-binding protein [Novosphingobium chloroacetimidivorans]MBB4860650.1 3-oxosteroid 1-dehydrogenase [Novosphingobium chloroacetimidivorans]